jgi:hypothetical protein
MIHHQLYRNAGLINQLMSIELAVGISEVSKQDLCIYNLKPDAAIFSASSSYNKRPSIVNNNNYFNITEVLNWNNKDVCLFLNEEVEIKEPHSTIDNLMNYYVDLEDGNDLDFSEGRTKLEFSNNMNIKNTLGFYSRFFNHRTKDLDQVLSSVRFLDEYYELSKIIADSLGDFNGLHLRLTDHVAQRVNTTEEMFNSGVEKVNDKNQLVLCTDDPNNKVVLDSPYNLIMLDSYIIENFGKDFSNLKYTDEVSFGLLNNLVMQYSKKFVGTIGSTYTAYIHRGMNQKSDIDWYWFDYLDNPVYKETGYGKYSWNKIPGIDTASKQWHREWKESKI